MCIVHRTFSFSSHHTNNIPSLGISRAIRCYLEYIYYNISFFFSSIQTFRGLCSRTRRRQVRVVQTFFPQLLLCNDRLIIVLLSIYKGCIGNPCTVQCSSRGRQSKKYVLDTMILQRVYVRRENLTFSSGVYILAFATVASNIIVVKFTKSNTHNMSREYIVVKWDRLHRRMYFKLPRPYNIIYTYSRINNWAPTVPYRLRHNLPLPPKI